MYCIQKTIQTGTTTATYYLRGKFQGKPVETRSADWARTFLSKPAAEKEAAALGNGWTVAKY